MHCATEDGHTDQPGQPPMVSLRLYIAGGGPNSVRALGNLRALCQEYLSGHHVLEVVDILEDPLRALAEGILVTPTLLKLSPAPARKIVGDLSDRQGVLLALGLEIEG